MTLVAYHGNVKTKREYLTRVRQHRKADLLAKLATGNPERGEKGCAVACTMNGYDHRRYPEEIGVLAPPQSPPQREHPKRPTQASPTAGRPRGAHAP